MADRINDIVRVTRIITFTGLRSKVDKQLEHSVHGNKDYGNGVMINVQTVGEYVLGNTDVVAIDVRDYNG